MKMKILQLPNPLLRQKSVEITDVNDEIRKTLNDMLETMYEARGVGLAAPQVGLLQRMVVIDIASKDEEPQPIKMINPVIVWRSDETESGSEGCLSIPNQYAPVERNVAVKVEYLDEKGKKQILDAQGFLAVAVQHELDHLDGIIFIDHLSDLRRKMLLKRHEKRLKKAALEEQE